MRRILKYKIFFVCAGAREAGTHKIKEIRESTSLGYDELQFARSVRYWLYLCSHQQTRWHRYGKEPNFDNDTVEARPPVQKK
jgi:hypothetical protein